TLRLAARSCRFADGGFAGAVVGRATVDAGLLEFDHVLSRIRGGRHCRRLRLLRSSTGGTHRNPQPATAGENQVYPARRRGGHHFSRSLVWLELDDGRARERRKGSA